MKQNKNTKKTLLKTLNLIRRRFTTEKWVNDLSIYQSEYIIMDI